MFLLRICLQSRKKHRRLFWLCTVTRFPPSIPTRGTKLGHLCVLALYAPAQTDGAYRANAFSTNCIKKKHCVRGGVTLLAIGPQ